MSSSESDEGNSHLIPIIENSVGIGGILSTCHKSTTSPKRLDEVKLSSSQIPCSLLDDFARSVTCICPPRFGFIPVDFVSLV